MLGEGLKYTSEPFYLPGSAVPERFVCRFPTVAERDAYWNVVESARNGDKIDGRKFGAAAVAAVAPLVTEHIDGDAGRPVTTEEVLNATPYHEVLVAIATTIFRGASFEGPGGAEEDS
jgi:hypothetical protein